MVLLSLVSPGYPYLQYVLFLSLLCAAGFAAEGGGHPFGLLLSWLLLLLSYCSSAVPDAALTSSSNSSSGLMSSLLETGAAATARIGVYTDLLRVLRLRQGICPLPVGPPHLIPRHLPMLPLLSIDKRVLPAECSTSSSSSSRLPDPRDSCAGAAAATAAADGAVQQQQQQHQGKLSVLAPRGTARPSSPVVKKQQEQAARLFGCCYIPKYPDQRHCHLPDPLLAPHVCCAILLYNLRRLGAPAMHWAAAVAPRMQGTDDAAMWAAAAVLTAAPAAATSAAAATEAKAIHTGDKNEDRGIVSVPPYGLKGESSEHLMQWLQWQQQPQPLLFSCGLNEEGSLGIGEAAFFPLDPVLDDRDNFTRAAKGADLWSDITTVSLPPSVSLSPSLSLYISVFSLCLCGSLCLWGCLPAVP